MVYQLSEKNQILVALFAIVVLCAGKLFKDYLFRQGYIEGLQVTTERSTQLRRKHVNNTGMNQQAVTTATTDNTVSASLDFLVTLGVDMVKSTSVSNVLVVTCPADVAEVVTLPSTLSSNVSATVTGATFAAPSISGRVVTFALSADGTIRSGSVIKITISGISIIPSVNSSATPPSNNTDINFTLALKVSSGGADKEPSVTRTVRILPALGGTSSDYVSPTAATSVEIQDAINGINARLAVTGNTGPSREEREYLLKARSALVTLLASTYGTVKEAGQVFDSDALYEAQRTAIDFIKNEKERAKNNAEALKQDNTNKRRMAQINTYYTRNYEANTEVMKNIIFVSIAIIVLAVLRNKELIPSSIATLGVIFVLTLGGIVIGKQVIDIMWRDDHDFDKYNWAFNEDEVNRKQLVQQNADPSNLSEMGMGMAPCYGPGCCHVGTTWDNSAKKCVPSVGRIYDSSAKWTSAANGTVTISFKSKSALSSSATADKVYITLPDGLFTTMSTTAPSGFTWTNPSVTAPIELTVTTTIAADTEITIALTGLTISTSQYSISKTLKVKTSKDISEVPIEITDIPLTIK
jgi:hypothetical protein